MAPVNESKACLPFLDGEIAGALHLTSSCSKLEGLHYLNERWRRTSFKSRILQFIQPSTKTDAYISVSHSVKIKNGFTKDRFAQSDHSRMGTRVPEQAE